MANLKSSHQQSERIRLVTLCVHILTLRQSSPAVSCLDYTRYMRVGEVAESTRRFLFQRICSLQHVVQV
jgi:hypothetical protein